uniref:Ribosomal protein S17 n=1 Tax=Hepatozoon canis TaxID=110120 RepID=A0A3S8TEJ3_9APIC|nr:ribosomal protein S17 [Hepatozoon canis]
MNILTGIVIHKSHKKIKILTKNITIISLKYPILKFYKVLQYIKDSRNEFNYGDKVYIYYNDSNKYIIKIKYHKNDTN